MPAPRPLAVTMGEPAGIGGELTLRAWVARHRDAGACFFTLDDPARLTRLAEQLGLRVAVRPVASPAEAPSVFADALPVLTVPLPQTAVAGKPDPVNAPATIASIERAAGLAMSGEAGAIVTNPIQKSTLAQAGFPHPGHTEFLATLAACGAPVPTVAMMLACRSLRVVPVTIHMALRQVFAELTTERIVSIGAIAAEALQRDFGIARPRIAVAGLNPHAGEAGTMGTEELAIIAPAIARLRDQGIDASGPWPPDTMFHAAARERYDAALCMYHDQALIPLKTIDFAGGVNVTLGLPFVRTSPDHGTALDIAGKGRADPSSFLAALDLAAQMARQRAR
jgi:4-hydroxythreonine-4-phosphate dehydrogenase